MQICHRWKDCHPSTAAAPVDGRTRWNAPVIVTITLGLRQDFPGESAGRRAAQHRTHRVCRCCTSTPGTRVAGGLEEGTRITEQLLTGARGSWTQWDWAQPTGPHGELDTWPGAGGGGCRRAHRVYGGCLRPQDLGGRRPRQRYRRAMDRDGDSTGPVADVVLGRRNAIQFVTVRTCWQIWWCGPEWRSARPGRGAYLNASSLPKCSASR